MYIEQLTAGTKLQVGIKGVGVALTSEFIGMLKDECLIITSPTPFMPIKQKLFPGNRIVVKFPYKDSAVIFQANIIESIKRPRMVVLEYPDTVTKQ